MFRCPFAIVALLAGSTAVVGCGQGDGDGVAGPQSERAEDDFDPTTAPTSSPTGAAVPATSVSIASTETEETSNTAEVRATPTSSEPTSTSADGTVTTRTSSDLDVSDADQRDLSLVDPLINTAAIHARLGIATLSVEDVAREFPRARLDRYYNVEGLVVVGVPLESSCAWFFGSATGEVHLAESDGSSCDPSGELSSPSIDGNGLSWSSDALTRIDTIAQLNATAVLEGLTRAMLVGGLSPTPSDIQAAFPGLRVVGDDDASASARELSLELNSSTGDVAIAVRGQSGRCYMISAHISSDTTVSYGTGEDCTATTAASIATEPDWP